MWKRSAIFICSLALLAPVASARKPPVAACATSPENTAEAGYLHARSAARRGGVQASRIRALQSAAAANVDNGQIAIIDDADGAVAQPNAFNLAGRTVRFLPSNSDASRYRVSLADGSFDSSAASSGAKLASLGDDDASQVYLSFDFPYYGARYRTLWVNSDGNLTFGAGDGGSTDRTLGRLTGGSPRIAPLFTDLDPTQARGASGVRVLNEQNRLVVTWQAVPLYSDSGFGAPQTFQVRLFPDGRIEMTWDVVNLSEAITGIGPGKLRGALSLVSLVSGPQDEYSGPVVDRFTYTASIDIATVAQKFYATHGDAYDYLVVYNAMGVLASSTAVAYEVTVRNPRSGIGDAVVDKGAEYGSPRRLQAVLNMGPLYQYPDNLSAAVPSRQPTGDTPLSVLAHETGHLFLAYASVADPLNPSAQPMLGRSLVHWSFNFNSEASFLEGTRLEDLGPTISPRFRTVATVQQYSPLDQYLMGFRSREEVPPTFLVNGSPYPNNYFPMVGVQFDGVRRDVSIDDVIAAVGRRVPDSTVAQRRFRFAFILIVQSGQPVQSSQVAKVESIRAAFEGYFAAGASNRAVADTGLRRAVQLSAAPAAGIAVNGTGTISLAVDAPASSPLSFALAAPGGVVQVPASVTIPAGASQASFQAAGLREGVAEFTATPVDPAFETAAARLQVRPLGSTLSLNLLTPRNPAAITEPVRVQVVDANQLPYSGVRVTAAVSSGTLAAASVVTDAAGVAAFTWTPAAASGTLRATIDGAPGSTATVTLSGRPAVADGAIVNGASFVAGVTPGSFATIFGSNLTSGVTATLAAPLPYGVQGVQVLVNGVAAQLSHVSDGQINFVVPWGLTGASASIEIDNPAGQFTGYKAALNALQPGVFALANNLGAVLIAGTGLTTDARRAKAGDTLEIYATGLGAVTASTAYLGLQETVTPAKVFIGGVEAEAVVSVLSPEFPGLYQINARVAAGTPAGAQPLTVVMGAARGNEVLVRIAAN